jgi:hypothetical protein
MLSFGNAKVSRCHGILRDLHLTYIWLEPILLVKVPNFIIFKNVSHDNHEIIKQLSLLGFLEKFSLNALLF